MEFFVQRGEENHLRGLFLWLHSMCSAYCLAVKLEQSLTCDDVTKR